MWINIKKKIIKIFFDCDDLFQIDFFVYYGGTGFSVDLNVHFTVTFENDVVTLIEIKASLDRKKG